MATQQDYTAAANAILAVMQSIVQGYAASYPDIMNWEEKADQLLPSYAGELAKAAVDAVDAERAAAKSARKPKVL